MALKIRRAAMPTAKYSIKCPYVMNPTRIVIHNTANDASAANEIAYMQSNNAQASFHYAVDEKEAVQGVELWRNAWHAGDGPNGPGNRKGIAIEICWSKSGGTRFDAAEENGAELAAKLLIDFGWGIDKVTKHQDYSGKYCPHRTLDKGWQRFLDMVEKKRRILAGMDVEENDSMTKLNGYTIERAKDFAVCYWDANKKGAEYDSYINGGFFGPYAESNMEFTLPVGNLVCDMLPASISLAAAKYLTKHITGTKLRWSTSESAQFRGKAVTTLVLPHTGSPYVAEISVPPANVRYAISGIPVIRDGVDVSYKNFVVPQGWDVSPFRAAKRNFIGIKGTALYIVSGASKTDNFVANSEVYDAVRAFGFSDLIALDGGGSWIHKSAGKTSSTSENRRINNIIRY